MIKLEFQNGREIMTFIVRNREIFYSDRLWDKPIRCIPRDEQFIQKVRLSRNRYPEKLVTMFTLSEAQEKEYNSATTEKELAQIIIKDCGLKGLKLLRSQEIDGKS